MIKKSDDTIRKVHPPYSLLILQMETNIRHRNSLILKSKNQTDVVDDSNPRYPIWQLAECPSWMNSFHERFWTWLQLSVRKTLRFAFKMQKVSIQARHTHEIRYLLLVKKTPYEVEAGGCGVSVLRRGSWQVKSGVAHGHLMGRASLSTDRCIPRSFKPAASQMGPEYSTEARLLSIGCMENAAIAIILEVPTRRLLQVYGRASPGPVFPFCEFNSRSPSSTYS